MSGSVNNNAQLGAVYQQAAATANFLTKANASLPEMFMAIQMERANILENQVIGQMEDMQKRNEWLRDANAALAALRAARPGDDKTKVSFESITFTDSTGKTVNALEWTRANGIATGLDWDTIDNARTARQTMDEALAKNWPANELREYPTMQLSDGSKVPVNRWGGDTRQYASFDNNNADNVAFRSEFENLRNRINDDLTNGVGGLDQSKFDAAIQNFKAAIDTANTNSQMDMVRLQGLMDKRNQTFDLLSNTLSKTGKNMDNVIGNMR